MTPPTRPILNPSHKDHVLLDTNDRYDAWNTGRDGPEDYREGGLKIAYDGAGSIPQIILNGCDGEVSLTGIAEIKAAETALREGRELADKFGPVLTGLDYLRKRGLAT